jgi:endoglucanase
VRQLETRGVVVDLDLHWSAPGSKLATGQREMADVDHSLEFWRQVAAAYGNDPHVIFELYNEPHGVTWQCWRDGCLVPPNGPTAAYQAAGMQQLVSTVRATKARNPLILDGLAHATDFSAWRQYMPDDPDHALVAAWHVYGPSECHLSCWERTVSDLQRVPLLVTEFGDRACKSAFVDDFMSWLDQRGIGYLAWAWNTWSGCEGPSLLETYAGVPHGAYGAAVMHHLQARFPAP